MESGMTYPPALIATGPLKGVTSQHQPGAGYILEQLEAAVAAERTLQTRRLAGANPHLSHSGGSHAGLLASGSRVAAG